MPHREIDSPSSDGGQLIASLLARIDLLVEQIAAGDERIDELLALVKALNARIAELEARRDRPPKTPDFKDLLKDACAVGHRRPDLADATIAAHRRRLERQLERLLARKPTDPEGRKLRDAVYVDCSDKLFVFLNRRDAEPTNNESERALRPSVIFRKVTNGFRSEWGAKTYAALCSIVETGRRNGRSALTAIRDALAVPTPEPTAA